ncbi:MAG: GNAT family N-acetyltransferase [Clostridiales bacterium]|nr:GNAT family N-acetyltransferase [Clostridiales bacterium]
MMDVFKQLPQFESNKFILRALKSNDADDLLKVYSDEKAVPFFNGDNCHGDDFHYTTLERMAEAVKFWLWSYEQGYFVRWAVVDKSTDTAIGTIELFHRDDESETYKNGGLLRLDIHSDYENKNDIFEIISAIKDSVYDLFWCDKIITKVNPFATERRSAIEKLGFKLADTPLIGNEGEQFTDYYILNK